MSSKRPGTEASQVALAPIEDRHVTLILEWFEAPHVRRWWGDPRVNASELIWHRKAPPPNGCRLILAGGRPVGYVQWTDLHAYFSASPSDLPAGTIDIDILIGDTDMTGRGIGPRAIAETVELIRREGAPPLITMFTQAENKPAMRAYESLGFNKAKRMINDSGSAEWLMTIDPAVWTYPPHLKND